MSSVYSDAPPAHVEGLDVERRPSSSERWFACPGSVWASAVLPPLPTSIFAENGTAAHWALSEILDHRPIRVGDPAPNQVRLDGDMVRYGTNASEHIRDSLAYILGPEATVGYESHVRYVSPLGDAVEGTADVAAESPSALVVVDYKYGVGKYVRETGNTQLGIYGLALRQKEGRRAKYYLGILQPRYRADNADAIRWAILTDTDMDVFEKNLLAAIARTKMFPTNFCSGSHCFFCPGKLVCPAVCADFLQALVKRGKVVNPYNDPINMWVLDRADSVKMLASRVQEEAEEYAKMGGVINGYEIVKSFGNRKWNEDALDGLITEAVKFGLSRETVSRETVKPIGIVEAEKLGLDVSTLTTKPEKLKLVKSSKSDSLKGF